MKDGKIVKKIVIIAFNFGFAGRYVNGPGICLYNLYNILKKHTSVDVKIFTKMHAHGQFNSDDIFSIDDKEYLSECIKNCDILHHWSGLANIYSNISYFNYDDIRLQLVYGPKENIITITSSEHGSLYKNTIRTKYQSEGSWNSLYLETFMSSNYKYFSGNEYDIYYTEIVF